MSFPMLSLRRLAVSAPENLVLCSTSTLIDLFKTAGCDPAVAGAALAELTVRWLLGDSLEQGKVREEMKDIESLLRSVIPGAGLPSALVALRMDPQGAVDSLDSRLWTTCDASQRDVERIVRRRLQHLYRQTDGFVPVFDTTDGHASFIPFRLADVVSEGDAAAVDVSTEAGQSIAGWESPARAVLRGSGKRMVVSYRQREDTPPLVGNSFMLPLKVALLKSQGTLPDYPVWSLLFTGALDAAGGLIPVAVKEKSAGVKARFQRSVRLVAPSDLSFADEVRDVDPLPVGLKDGELTEALKMRVEGLPGVQMSWKYANARLPVLEEQMRRDTVDQWDRQIARADAMLKLFGRRAAPGQHLQLLMLKSAAYCHSGRTEDALRENLKAHELAVSQGLRYQALRLEIEQLVEFQDSQRFDDIAALERSLAEQLERPESLSDAERNDLMMRFDGTMGQVLLERSLIGDDAALADAAQKRIERALEFAQRLDKPEEIVHDLNYLHLWHVYWKPEEESSVFEEAKGVCSGLESEGTRAKNEAYQLRQQAIARFQVWKRTGVVPADWRELRAPMLRDESWLDASVARMKGALAASAGSMDEAERIFSVGESSFPMQKWWSSEGDALSAGGVFAQIRLALLVQAYCSLAKTNPGESARYGRLVTELISCCPNVKNRKNVDKLLVFMRDPETADPRSLPVLYY